MRLAHPSGAAARPSELRARDSDCVMRHLHARRPAIAKPSHEMS